MVSNLHLGHLKGNNHNPSLKGLANDHHMVINHILQVEDSLQLLFKQGYNPRTTNLFSAIYRGPMSPPCV